MNITLELDTRYHERQKEKSHHQERKPEASKSNSSHPQSYSSSTQKEKNFQKRDKPHSSSLNKYFKLMNFEKERRIKEDLCAYGGGKNSLESCLKRPQNKITQLTPSFPSSVHITSHDYHTSLLSSRDGVCKEIQDVGEDNSVSSLHLFFGNMELPHSSYHDSLEELWDEEEEPEEIETVMKVVPSSYHQYLDLFSKVKAEKLPPHHSCDHHIELEGSLPPVGVSSSLSNQE
ncbi:hypothetical protein O181_102098 [Austropuccinia psidii MF-1]|uniref:Uncharacterized protein n=1 Tax=Austropuccinia psidii MF-1 TaxID=1389203 RepID=A0A9Q3PHS3_9BASI|nr:hypothetical protein [Austropuccinia psidii MF-1]